jgi:phospholipase C
MRITGFAAALAAAIILAVSGCGGGGGSGGGSGPPVVTPTQQPTTPPLTIPRPGQIQHVVIIVQENRSFDNLFHDFPNADTAPSGIRSNGETVPLYSLPLEAPGGYGHALADYNVDYNGGLMNGFDREGGVAGGTAAYAFVPNSETVPYFAMGEQFVVGDRMFASNLDASFVAHQYLIAGQAANTVDFPLTNWGCQGGTNDLIHTITSARTYGKQIVACFNYTTLADELTTSHLTWRYYAPQVHDPGGIWSAYQAVNHICGTVSKGVCTGSSFTANVISPETQILSDVPAGSLANVTWVIPDWLNSDHAGNLSKTGPAWVASVVNAIGESKLWPHTAIFVVWDDWGGWYDHVAPPQLDADGLGFRVPLVCISPFAARGVVSHVQYEFGSILHFAEDAFSLPQFAVSDRRATSAAVGCMNFHQAPRAFTPIGGAGSMRDPRRIRHSGRAPDDD